MGYYNMRDESFVSALGPDETMGPLPRPCPCQHAPSVAACLAAGCRCHDNDPLRGEPCADGHRPDDEPESGDRCKDCGRRIVWVGPSHLDWETAIGE